MSTVIAAVLLLLLPAVPTAQQPHAGSVTPADIEAGSRLYSAQCAGCHGTAGNLVAGVDLARGTFRTGSSDEALARTIREGIPGTAMRAHTFTPQEMSVLIAYIRSMGSGGGKPGAVTLDGANPQAGRALVEGKGRCLTCHRINGQGARRSTDLSDSGVTRLPEAIIGALVKPPSSVAAERRFVRATTADGKVITGRRMNEDTFTVQLLDDQDRLISLTKSELRDYSVSTALPSTPHTVPLTDNERRDIVSYLLTLRGVEPALQRGRP